MAAHGLAVEIVLGRLGAHSDHPATAVSGQRVESLNRSLCVSVVWFELEPINECRARIQDKR
jgi:hypothetical protein